MNFIQYLMLRLVHQSMVHCVKSCLNIYVIGSSSTIQSLWDLSVAVQWPVLFQRLNMIWLVSHEFYREINLSQVKSC